MSATLEVIGCCAPLASSNLSEEEAEATADVPVCMCDLIGPVGLAQPTVSHHMKKLLDAGLVEREQRGKWAYFSLNRDAVSKLAVVADLKGACC